VRRDQIHATVARAHSQALVSGIGPAFPDFYSTRINAELHQIVGRLSYKFDWSGGPAARRRPLLISRISSRESPEQLLGAFSHLYVVARHAADSAARVDDAFRLVQKGGR
jgi:hypothetical protein